MIDKFLINKVDFTQQIWFYRIMLCVACTDNEEFVKKIGAKNTFNLESVRERVETSIRSLQKFSLSLTIKTFYMFTK